MKKLVAALLVAMSAVCVSFAQCPARERCPDCKGSKTHVKVEVCSQCAGRGYLCNAFGDYTAKCPSCSKNMIANTMTWRGRVRTVGSGKTKTTVKCETCKGEGWIQKAVVKTLNVTKAQWAKINALLEINGEVELSKSGLRIVVRD